MLLDIIEVNSRLESPNNLMNRLKELNKSSSRDRLIPSLPDFAKVPKIDDLVEDIEERLARTTSKSHAVSVMNRCLAKLENEIEAVPATKLAAVAKDMSLVIKNLEPELGSNTNNGVQFIVHCPVLKDESEYEVVSSNE